MASSLEILIKAKNDSDAAFKAVITNLQGTQKESTKASQSLDSVTVRAGKLSDAIGKTSTTLARSADAFGLSAGAMRNIGDVADVAQLGFDNLSKSAAGFNAASLAVVGAGFAIGTALGKMAMEFDIVKDNAYAAGVAIQNAFSSQQVQGANEMAAAAANWAIESKKVAAANEELLRSQTSGKSAEEIKAMLFPEPPKGIRERILDEAKAFEEAQKKKEAAAKRAAEAATAAAKQASAERLRAVEEENRLREHTANEWDKFFQTLSKEESNLTDWVEAEAKARTDIIVKGLAEEMLAAREAAEDRKKSYLEMSEAISEGIRRQQEAELDAAGEFAGQLRDLVGILDDFGISADSAFSHVLSGFANGIDAAIEFQKATTIAGKAMAALHAAQSALNSGSALGGAAAGAAFGSQFGIIGAGIGAVGGALLGLFGKAKAAREEMNKLRDEFARSAGGMDALKKQAAAAGVSLDGMFKQKSAAALAHQIDAIKAKLADWDNAQKVLTDGMAKWGIAVGDMGAKFAGLQLDERAKEMALFFAAAGQVGADMGAVAAGMASDVKDLVAQYQAAGLAIPQALRPILEAMLKNGELVDENGVAFNSLEEAGIKFGETMEGALSNIADQIEKLMRVLAQGFHIPITYDVNEGSAGSGSSGSSGGSAGGHPPREEDPGFAGGGVGNFGSGRSATLHGREGILPLDDRRAMAMIAEAIASATSASGGGGSTGDITVVSPIQIGQRQLGQAVATVSRRRVGRVSPAGIRRQ